MNKKTKPLQLVKIKRIVWEGDKKFRQRFAKRLQKARAQKWSVAEFARLLGKNNWQILRYESGSQSPNLETLCKICMLLQIEVHELLGISYKNFLVVKNNRTIFTWSLKIINSSGAVGLYWDCPICSHKNVEYLKKWPKKIEAMPQNNLSCETCGNFSNKFYQLTLQRLQKLESFSQKFNKENGVFGNEV